MRSITLALILCCAHPPVARAAEPVKRSGTLTIVHSAGQVVNRTHGHNNGAPPSTERLERTMAYTLRGGEVLTIEVDKANTLLFEYHWRGVKKTQTADYEAVLAFAKAVAAAVAVLPKAKTGARVAGVDDFETQFATHLRTLRSHIDSIPRHLKASVIETQIPDMKQEVARWNVEALSSFFDKAFDSVNAEVVRLLTNTNDLKKRLQDDPAEVHTLHLMRDQEGPIREMLKAAATFQLEVGLLYEKPIELGRIEYSSTEISTATVEIVPVKGREGLAKQTNRTTGELAFQFRPYRLINFSFGPAFVYSFVRDTDATDADFVGQQIAAMLTLTFAHRDDPAVAPSVHVGLNPMKDRVGLFTGASLRLFGLVQFGGGFTYQQVMRAGKIEFEPGGYFLLGATLPK